MKVELTEDGYTPDGKWKLVPVEPSSEQRLASKRYRAKNKIPTGPGIYKVMIQFSPKPEFFMKDKV
ncbi:hypothetical protein [Serratia ficaria]|uniref:hypothetical protein n=1 Tax=Serratia ficaria TaxID=61651 RepID=UPI0021B749D6|nr:hypothetical protein [Serratia ficaria]